MRGHGDEYLEFIESVNQSDAISMPAERTRLNN
jgi:hypothetical protein